MLSRPPHQHPLDCQYQQKRSLKLFEQQLNTTADKVPLQVMDWPELNRRGITAYLRRDDELPVAPGNKFYKLYYNLLNARQQGCHTLVSFGGAYSNHIYALAAASNLLGLESVGIIRGHQPKMLSPTLSDASEFGMKLHFLNKKDYGRKDIRSLLPILKGMLGEYYLIPEGGENLAGVRGCIAIAQAISKQLQQPYTLCSAVGTGSTLAGLIAGSPPQTQVLGVRVLKGADSLTSKVHEWLSVLGASVVPKMNRVKWQIETDYHHGGYAKTNSELMGFMHRFEQRNAVLLDPVYTAKMLWAIEALAKQGYWPEGSHIVAIHSGGLQGRRGFDLSMTL